MDKIDEIVELRKNVADLSYMLHRVLANPTNSMLAHLARELLDKVGFEPTILREKEK